MASLRRFVCRLFYVFFPDLGEKQLAREIASHLTLIEDELQRRGMTPEDARLEARRLIGGIERTKDLHRDERSLAWMDDLRRDVRYGARTLLRNPGFTGIAVLTLALGIGANTAIFSVISSVLLKPLPYADADRLVRVMMSLPADASPSGAPLRRAVALSAVEVADVQARTKTLSYVGIAQPELVGLAGGHEEAARLLGARISASALQMLRVQPVLGRLFTPQDEAAGAEPVILIAYAAWQRYFGGDSAIVGRSLTLDSVLGPRRQSQYTVVGVMPGGFGFPQTGTLFWRPVQPPVAGVRNVPRGALLGKLADGVSIEAATTELAPLVRAVREGERGKRRCHL